MDKAWISETDRNSVTKPWVAGRLNLFFAINPRSATSSDWTSVGHSFLKTPLLVALELRSEYEVGGSIFGARDLLAFA